VTVQAYKGSHGTCMSMARIIEQEGFLTNPGRIGTGAYFWTAVEDEHLHLSTHYAITWAERARTKWKAFEGQEDQSLAVIQVEVEADEEEILYLDDPEHHLDLRLELTDFAVEHFGLKSIFDLTQKQFNDIEKLLYGIVDTFIKFYEEALGDKKVKLVFKNQQPPVVDKLIQIVGNASCFAVRDTSCLTALHVSAV